MSFDWSGSKQSARQQGSTLVEALIAVACLGLLVAAGLATLSRYQEAVQAAVGLGEKEDLRQFLRRSVDCEQTLARARKACSTRESPVRAYNAKANPITDPSGHARLGTYDVRLTCRPTEFETIAVDAEYKHFKSASWKSLLEVPIECSLCPSVVQSHFYFGSVPDQTCSGPELVVNGGFDATPPPTRNTSAKPSAISTASMNFSSSFSYDDRCLVPRPTFGHNDTCFPNAGHVSVWPSPRACHFVYADLCSDDGNMLVMNPGPSRRDFWCQKVSATIGEQYEFAVRVRTAVGPAYPGYRTAHRWYVKGHPEFVIDAVPRTEAGGWEEHRGRFVAKSAAVELCGMNIDTAGETGDLVVDDISLRSCRE